MRIFGSLQDRIPETGSAQRVALLGPDDGTSKISVVLVRVPPHHEFPLHIHPHSEDCFFVLSGAGEVFSPDRRFGISEVAGAWVPVGVPHGLATGALDVIEIGFQSPPGSTVEVIDDDVCSDAPYEIAVTPVSVEPPQGRKIPEWGQVFAGQRNWQYLDPQYCCLELSQQLHVAADEREFLVVVARGAVELCKSAACAGAITVIQLGAGESEILRAVEADTLLLGIQSLAI